MTYCYVKQGLSRIPERHTSATTVALYIQPLAAIVGAFSRLNVIPPATSDTHQANQIPPGATLG